MEPVAPGTEDDITDFSSLTKKDAENQRLLKQKAILRNGQYETIFELRYVDGVEHWYCKLCECPTIGRVFQHATGRKHTTRLKMANRVENDSVRENVNSNEVSNIEIPPGEPVPPGEKPRFVRPAQIQERLDGFKIAPLVALEYLIEMYDYDSSKEPLYLCILCDKRGDPRTVLTHLASYNHLSQYLQKHFPSCYRALAPYMTKQYKRNWQMVLHKIAEAIEKYFGRLRPFCIERDKFEKDCMQYVTMISKGQHFSEQTGPSFVELVVHEELTKTHDASLTDNKPVTENSKQKPTPSSSAIEPVVQKATEVKKTDLNKSNVSKAAANKVPIKTTQKREGYNKHVQSYNKHRASSVSSTSSNDGRKSPVRRQYRPIRRRSSSRDRDQGKDFPRQQVREKDRLTKLEEYKRLCKAIENDMEKTLKIHEKNPEKHPKYNDEWKLFWNRRYKELQSESKDASKYDYKPEWIDFWGKRMLAIYQDELKVRKEALRKRLGLPEEKSRISFRIGPPTALKTSAKPEESDQNKSSPTMAGNSNNECEIILIDDKDDKSESESNSPWEKESPPRSIRKSSKNSSPPIKRSKDDYSKERRLSRKDPVFKKRKSIDRRSHERSRFELRHRSRSRDSRRDRLRSPLRSLSRDRRSRSPDSLYRRHYSRERDYRYHRGYSRERSRENERHLKRSLEPELRELRERIRTMSDLTREKDKNKIMRQSSLEPEIREVRERIRTTADLPWEKDKFMYKRSAHEFDYYGAPSAKRNMSHMMPHYPDSDNDNDDINIVSLLRLLTALEEKLGSLGPKIIDMLAQALALEKREPNSSETLLDSDINCVMFETVKEKLKGQLSAGLVGHLQERAFKKAIQRTANLIHYAGERKRKKDQFKLDVVEVNKAAIAKQLANALIAQGKTDVTQEQLEQLVNTVVGMAEASKASKKPVTAAEFISQLTGENSDKSEQPKEKIIIPRVKSKLDKIDSSRDSDHVDLDKLTEPLSPCTFEKTTGAMENLSDSDLQMLLQNFKDLSADEQMNLINYLKKLELDEPNRVERLRKFVNLGSERINSTAADLENEDTRKSGRDSPFSSRVEGLNPDAGDVKSKNESSTIHIDSEDEDYTYEDVVKAVSKNIKEQEIERSDSPLNQKESNLTVAKTLISNLMSTFSSNTSASGVNLLGLCAVSTQSKPTISVPTSSSDLALNNLSDINVDNLTKIVNSVQKVSQNNEQNNASQEPAISQMEVLSDDRSNSAGFSSNSELSGLKTISSDNAINYLLNPSPRLQPTQPFRNSDSQIDSRNMLIGPPQLMRPNIRPPSTVIQGYSNLNMGPRTGPPVMFNQRSQYSDNIPGGNQNQNFLNTRPGRPLLNLTFVNPRFRGPTPRSSGPNSFNRW